MFIFYHFKIIASILFLGFGIKLLWEAYHTNPSAPSDELIEAEKEVKERVEEIKIGDLEMGEKSTIPLCKGKKMIFLEAFSLTFFGEWGDRS
mmetsp:Transcript_12309/g.6129  ORF Transcript_12309/g.6129 Transcript_12309/m.6129 type:complete len:92 (+) Transcript_12309:154-429(+)